MASEKVVCRYDTEIRSDYSQLRYAFDEQVSETDFNKLKREEVHINSSQARDYTYYAACMDKAEWATNVTQIRFSVDLNAAFTIDVSRMPVITDSSSADIDITTNKKARCSWGLSENTISNYVEDYEESEFKRAPCTWREQDLFQVL